MTFEDWWAENKDEVLALRNTSDVAQVVWHAARRDLLTSHREPPGHVHVGVEPLGGDDDG